MLRAAFGHAAAIGKPLSHWVSISWWLVPGEGDPAQRFDAFRRRLLPQLRRWAAKAGQDPRSVSLVYAGVHEAPGGRSHTHVGVHLQPGILPTGRGVVVRTLRRLAFGKGRHAAASLAFGPCDAGVLTYMTKGLPADQHERHGVRPDWSAGQGVVAGKRIAISTATLGQAARARADVTPGAPDALCPTATAPAASPSVPPAAACPWRLGYSRIHPGVIAAVPRSPAPAKPPSPAAPQAPTTVPTDLAGDGRLDVWVSGPPPGPASSPPLAAPPRDRP
ncbi:hypothetical protein [Azospirillum sp. A39]